MIDPLEKSFCAELFSLVQQVQMWRRGGLTRYQYRVNPQQQSTVQKQPPCRKSSKMKMLIHILFLDLS